MYIELTEKLKFMKCTFENFIELYILYNILPEVFAFALKTQKSRNVRKLKKKPLKIFEILFKFWAHLVY